MSLPWKQRSNYIYFVKCLFHFEKSKTDDKFKSYDNVLSFLSMENEFIRITGVSGKVFSTWQ